MGYAKVLLRALMALVVAAAVAAPAPPGMDELDRLTARDIPIQLNFQRVGLDKIFSALAAVAGVKVVIEGQLPAVFSTEIHETPFVRVLQLIGEKAGLRYRVPDPNTLVVVGSAEPPKGELVLIAGDTPQDAATKATTAPIPLDPEPPAYPQEALGTHVSGKVALQIVVGADGAVRDVKVLRAEPPNQVFEEAAVAGVKGWHYEPARRDGKPVEGVTTAIIEFEPSDGAAE